MADLLKFFVRQLQTEEPLHFLSRIPKGVVAAVDHPFRAEGSDVMLCDTFGHEHKGAGYIENAVLIVELLIGGFIHTVSAEVGSDGLQLGKIVQDFSQLDRVGVIIPMVAHVEHHRDLALNGFVQGKQPGIINGETLGIRVHLDAMETHVHDPLRFVG